MHRHIHYITPWRNNTRMPNKQTLAVPARLSSGRNLSPGLFIWPPCIISPCTTHYIQDTWTISLSHVDDQHPTHSRDFTIHDHDHIIDHEYLIHINIKSAIDQLLTYFLVLVCVLGLTAQDSVRLLSFYI